MIPKPVTMILYTNRNTIIFDTAGEQIGEAQQAISCYRVNKKKAQEVCEEAEHFFIARFGEWKQSISRREMEYLLGLRTSKKDIAEIEAKRES